MSRTFFRIDFLLLAPVVVLLIISLTTLFSVQEALFRSQLISVSIGLIAFFFFSHIRLEVLRNGKIIFYCISLILLGIVLALGIESHGAVRWLSFFGITLQFSEILKPFLALVLASFLADTPFFTFKTFLKCIGFLLPVLLLIDLQPDLGNALVYASVAFFVLIVRGFPWRWFGFLLLPFAIMLPFLWTRLHEYQRLRLLTFIHPTSDPLGASYNSIQATIAVGSGSLLGKGLSQGTQSGLRFLPERHTDFIFATIAEGLGFIGASVIVVAFLFLCLQIYSIYQRAHDPFVKLFAVACFGFFLIQSFFNIGMNLGYLPIVGVTLPFVSFGGSSLVSSFIFLGILSSMSVDSQNKDVLEIR